MSKMAAIPMDKELQSFQFIFTGQQYLFLFKVNLFYFCLHYKRKVE